MNFYKHHLGDYDGHTAHLSWDEDMAYTRLMRAYYRREKAIPQAEAYRLCRAQTRSQRQAVDTVLTEFFSLADDGYHNKRCDEEIVEFHEGDDEREQKAANEAERMKRYRERRKELFETLRLRGIVVKWDTKMEELERLCNAPATRTDTHLQREQEHNLNGGATANQIPEPLTSTTPVPTPTGVGVAVAPPDCPHEQIIALYHELLPECPRVEEWHETRRGYLRSRWREKAKPNGKTAGYVSIDDGLQWWKKFFAYCAQSDFLTGKGDGRPGKPPFVANLEWLVRPTNFAKVIEGNFHR